MITIKFLKFKNIYPIFNLIIISCSVALSFISGIIITDNQYKFTVNTWSLRVQFSPSKHDLFNSRVHSHSFTTDGSDNVVSEYNNFILEPDQLCYDLILTQLEVLTTSTNSYRSELFLYPIPQLTDEVSETLKIFCFYENDMLLDEVVDISNNNGRLLVKEIKCGSLLYGILKLYTVSEVSYYIDYLAEKVSSAISLIMANSYSNTEKLIRNSNQLKESYGNIHRAIQVIFTMLNLLRKRFLFFLLNHFK